MFITDNMTIIIVYREMGKRILCELREQFVNKKNENETCIVSAKRKLDE